MDGSLATPRENYEWFQENLPALEKQHGDKYVVIRDRQVIAVFGNQREAFESMRKRRERPGTFIIQLCSSDEKKVLNVFHSLASFR
ncbi:MAG: hypothetical protein LBL73_01060 [Synergistaceae bacterium]|nr:hypothetical protein [Synergistaceae bacterium]